MLVQKNLVNEAVKTNYGNEVEKKEIPEFPIPTISLKNYTKVNFSESFSINKTIAKSNEVKEQITLDETLNRPKDIFSLEQLHEKWNAYKNFLNQNKQSILASAFETMPTMDGNEISILIDNSALEKTFNDIKSDILGFFRKELNNYGLTITTKINYDSKSRKAYTPQEKFAKMSKKNPHLMTLIKTFDMNINYPNK